MSNKEKEEVVWVNLGIRSPKNIIEACRKDHEFLGYLDMLVIERARYNPTLKNIFIVRLLKIQITHYYL